ncbi:major capsid protein [Nitrospirillum bahiense]|uniref:Major capsid protein E n=1 Tax=Nitrospirillum amazonense TaxID=28077 RepID=A0A560F1W5_9PROT|nr:major capsid protein [Nitrospirillum amazonense]TWB15601.1 major capsid protein E [Nitrospirillum amazonense]
MVGMLDIFSDNPAFAQTEMTVAVNKRPFVPGKLGQMGLFAEKGITTTSVAIEELSGSLSLVPVTNRGDDPVRIKNPKRIMRQLTVPHLATEKRIKASEVQGVTQFGNPNALQTMQAVVQDKLDQQTRSHDATVEYQRIGAMKGIIYDADGTTVIYDLFNEFGVTQQTQPIAFSTGTTEVRTLLTDAAGMIEDELGADTYERLFCFCDALYFKALISHPTVKAAYSNYQQAEGIRTGDLRYQGFTFGGVTFQQYRGKVGATPFIEANTGYIFPIGVPDLFITRFAPADDFNSVNSIGLPRYSKIAVDPKYQQWVDVMVESNPISLCTRPRCVVKTTAS